LTDGNKKELLIFFRESGLKNIFENKNIKSVVDYVFGVEVGMDTNGRKNRTGDLMEDIVEKYISDFCKKNKDFEYLEQGTKKKIFEK
jgi:type II restriction enzyme